MVSYLTIHSHITGSGQSLSLNLLTSSSRNLWMPYRMTKNCRAIPERRRPNPQTKSCHRKKEKIFNYDNIILNFFELLKGLWYILTQNTNVERFTLNVFDQNYFCPGEREKYFSMNKGFTRLS